MLLLTLLSIIVFLSSLLLAFRFFPSSRESLTAFLSYTCFFSISAVIGIPMTLGIFEMLRPLPLTLGVLVYGIVSVLVAAKYFFGNFRFKKFNTSTGSRWSLLAFSFLAIFLLVEFGNALLQPVWEYDSIAYHLPFVRHWIAEGSLWKALFTPYTGPVGYYPGSGEILTLWNILPVGTDFFANTQNIFLMIFFAITAYDLGRKLGFSEGPALLAPILFLHSPIILKEIGSAHVDLFFALGFLYILYFGLEFIRTKEARLLLPLGIAFGLFVGSKYLALPYAFLAFLPLAFYFIKQFLTEKTKKSIYLFFLALGLVGFFLTGGFWYLRNLMLTGNPIFPAEIKIGSAVIFEGYGNMTEQILNWSLIKNLDTFAEIKSFIKQYLIRTGWQTIVLGVAYLVGIFFYLLKKSQRKTTLLFLIILPVFFYLYLATPYTFNDLDANIRYSILFLFMGALFTSFLSEHMKRVRIFMYGASAFLIFLTLRTALTTPDLPHELFNLRFIKQFAGNPTKIFRIREEQKFSILEHKYPSFAPLIHAFEWLEKNVKPENGIAYSGFHFRYPLASYISVNACVDCNYIDFNNKKDSIFAGANREVWLKNLTDAKIKYLVLFDQIGYLTYEPRWVSEFPEKFENVFKDGNVNIYAYQ